MRSPPLVARWTGVGGNRQKERGRKKRPVQGARAEVAEQKDFKGKNIGRFSGS